MSRQEDHYREMSGEDEESLNRTYPLSQIRCGYILYTLAVSVRSAVFF